MKPRNQQHKSQSNVCFWQNTRFWQNNLKDIPGQLEMLPIVWVLDLISKQKNTFSKENTVYNTILRAVYTFIFLREVVISE